MLSEIQCISREIILLVIARLQMNHSRLIIQRGTHIFVIFNLEKPNSRSHVVQSMELKNIVAVTYRKMFEVLKLHPFFGSRENRVEEYWQ